MTTCCVSAWLAELFFALRIAGQWMRAAEEMLVGWRNDAVFALDGRSESLPYGCIGHGVVWDVPELVLDAAS